MLLLWYKLHTLPLLRYPRSEMSLVFRPDRQSYLISARSAAAGEVSSYVKLSVWSQRGNSTRQMEPRVDVDLRQTRRMWAVPLSHVPRHTNPTFTFTNSRLETSSKQWLVRVKLIVIDWEWCRLLSIIQPSLFFVSCLVSDNHLIKWSKFSISFTITNRGLCTRSWLLFGLIYLYQFVFGKTSYSVIQFYIILKKY